jgi:prophage antirepressor-like protein
MSNIIPFEFEKFSVRVVDQNGSPWFIAADVCAALELGNVSQAIKRLDDDEQALISNEGIHRGSDQINVVNESGLYSLILGSRKPEAKKFKKWVTSEVLPAIRKTGSYTAGRTADQPDIIKANKLFKSCVSVAKLVFKGNQALLSANMATRKATGFDVLDSLGATALLSETQTVDLVASDIGRQFGQSGQKINDFLESIGLQTHMRDHKNRKVWMLTGDGQQFGKYVDTGKKHVDGSPVKQIKWSADVISILSKKMNTDGAA